MYLLLAHPKHFSQGEMFEPMHRALQEMSRTTDKMAMGLLAILRGQLCCWAWGNGMEN